MPPRRPGGGALFPADSPLSGTLTPELLDAVVELMGRSGRRGTVRVRGDSMRPTVAPDDLLAVDFSPSPPRFGDLLLFRQAGILVVHRFLGRARTRDGQHCLRTRGDAALALDPPLLPEHLVGRVVAIHRKGSWRSLQTRGADWYAKAVAAHDLFWAVAAVAAGATDRKLGLHGRSLALRRWVGSADRRLLRLADALWFERLHPAAPPPPEVIM